MDIGEFGMGRKRSREINGKPFHNYHTLSNNAVFPIDNNRLPDNVNNHTKHIPANQKGTYLLPTIRNLNVNPSIATKQSTSGATSYYAAANPQTMSHISIKPPDEPRLQSPQTQKDFNQSVYDIKYQSYS